MKTLYTAALRRIEDALFLKRIVPAFIVLVIGAWFYGSIEFDNELHVLQNQEAFYVGQGTAVLQNHLRTIRQDLLSLASQTNLIQHIQNPRPENIDYIRKILYIFSLNKGVYSQIAWVDQSGMEQIRIDQGFGTPRPLPAAELKDRAESPCFRVIQELDREEIFISSLGLSQQNDLVELPIKPIIRLATPVIDAQGTRHGMVFITYLAGEMLNNFLESTLPIRDRVSLLNSDGYWLVSPNLEDAWG